MGPRLSDAAGFEVGVSCRNVRMKKLLNLFRQKTADLTRTRRSSTAALEWQKFDLYQRASTAAGDQKWARGQLKYDGFPVL